MLSSALANRCRPTFSGSVKAVGRDWYEFLDAVFGAATNHMTVEGYAKRFRQIVSDIFGLSNGAAKHDYRQGGQQKWLEKVCSIKLREITPDKVQDWKRACLLTRSYGIHAASR